MSFSKKSMVFLLFYMSVCTAFTQTAINKDITLDEYRNLALSNNLSILTAQNDLEKSKQVRSGAFTHYFPKLNAIGGTVFPNIFGTAGAGFKTDVDMKKLLGVNFDLSYNTVNVDESVDFTDSVGGWLGTVTFTQTIFAGGRIFNSNKLAEKGVEAAVHKLQMVRNDVYAAAESKYYQFLLLHELVNTLNAYTDTLDAIYKQVSEALDNGVASKSDFLRVSLKKEEVAIQQEQMTQMLDIAGRDLKLFAGIKSDVRIVPKGEFETVKEPSFDAGRFPALLASRPEFRLLTLQRDAAKLEEAITFGSYLPSIEFGITFLKMDLWLNGKTFKNAKGYYYDFVGFLLFNIPITDWWEGYYKIKEQSLVLKSAAQELEINSEYLLLDMRNKFVSYQTAFKQVKLAEIGLKYAKNNVMEYGDRYRAGLSVLGEYLEALAFEYENATKLDKAKMDYFMARTAFYTAVGEAK
ncbi:MAG: TolC family protein [Spirochaetaceae bacterium]|nr:TolC family protein [Spirochaetaceae bacterium]